MKFNPTPLEIVVFLLVCLAVHVWTNRNHRIRRWSQDYFRQRRGPRYLKPKSPESLAYYHFCRPHQSLTVSIRGPGKRRCRIPVMVANLARKRWTVRDLLQLPVPKGIWLDSFPAAEGCR